MIQNWDDQCNHKVVKFRIIIPQMHNLTNPEKIDATSNIAHLFTHISNKKSKSEQMFKITAGINPSDDSSQKIRL